MKKVVTQMNAPARVLCGPEVQANGLGRQGSELCGFTVLIGEKRVKMRGVNQDLTSEQSRECDVGMRWRYIIKLVMTNSQLKAAHDRRNDL